MSRMVHLQALLAHLSSKFLFGSKVRLPIPQYSTTQHVTHKKSPHKFEMPFSCLSPFFHLDETVRSIFAAFPIFSISPFTSSSFEPLSPVCWGLSLLPRRRNLRPLIVAAANSVGHHLRFFASLTSGLLVNLVAILQSMLLSDASAPQTFSGLSSSVLRTCLSIYRCPHPLSTSFKFHHHVHCPPWKFMPTHE